MTNLFCSPFLLHLLIYLLSSSILGLPKSGGFCPDDPVVAVWTLKGVACTKMNMYSSHMLQILLERRVSIVMKKIIWKDS